MLMDIEIRKAIPSDAEEIVSLLIESQWFTYSSLYSAQYIKQMISHYYSLERVAKEIVTITPKWHGYYVAIFKNTVIGIIGGGLAEKGVGEIYIFYVKPSLIGQGVGSRLLTFYSKIQKHQFHATEQQVLVAKGNSKGIPFYENKGFTYCGEQPTYGSNAEDDDWSLKYIRPL